ncbi:MAG: hypothetical protein QNK23_00255 [Crocinitomicaceae bacterium]|nr:hypothetical protein [Crocinitomicaceae bacterium]
MLVDHQSTIFEIIKRKINGEDSVGNVVSEILNISHDAVYRRTRGETLLTIHELEKLCKHFSISLDSLFSLNKNKVLFDFQPLDQFGFSMDSYLQNLLQGMNAIKAQKNPQLTIAINNTPLFQLLNYPHLIRFKLFFWAKTHLQVPEYKDQLFKYDRISESTFAIGVNILKAYNTIPSKEVYDPDLLRGFVREILYYYKACLFEDPTYALHLLDKLDLFVDHLKAQAEVGKKFIVGTQAPASGNEFEMYYSETFNSATTVLYNSDEYSGLYIAHNLMNSLHTTDEVYINDSMGVLNKQLANSSVISIVNEKERNSFFAQLKKMIDQVRKKINLDLEEE